MRHWVDTCSQADEAATWPVKSRQVPVWSLELDVEPGRGRKCAVMSLAVGEDHGVGVQL